MTINHFLSTHKKQRRSLWKTCQNVTTGNLYNYLYHQNYYKLSGIDLSRQTNTNIPQQTNFIGRLEEDNSATMFSTAQKQQKLF